MAGVEINRTLSLPSRAQPGMELIRKPQSQHIAVHTGAVETRKLNQQPGGREPLRAFVVGSRQEE